MRALILALALSLAAQPVAAVDESGEGSLDVILDSTQHWVGTNDVRISDLGGTGDADYDAHKPAVASSSEEILVVWHGDDNENGLVDHENEIFGQRIDPGFIVFTDSFESGDTGNWPVVAP